MGAPEVILAAATIGAGVMQHRDIKKREDAAKKIKAPEPKGPIDIDSKEAQQAADRERRRRAMSRGRASTILSGINVEEPTIGVRTLGGG